MKILITGICCFTGSTFARTFHKFNSTVELCGIDNLLRTGSEQNRARLKALGVRLFHGDVRCPSDLDVLPNVEWVIDEAANASVLAGVSGDSNSHQLVEHNSVGTINLLEYCKRTCDAMRLPGSCWIRLEQSRSGRGSSRLLERILEEIAQHAQADPEWLEISGCA
jgi:nucleoside-diphosphate-sugar epimerase